MNQQEKQKVFLDLILPVRQKLEKYASAMARNREDARDLVRETTALLAPIKVLCSDACKGRCLVCGGNRNRRACSCRPDKASPFGTLKDLKLGKPDKPAKKKL